MDAAEGCRSGSSSDTVAIIAVVNGLCGLIAGLPLGFLLTRHIHCNWKTDQTESSPIYDIPADRKTNIEVKHNKAYGHIHT